MRTYGSRAAQQFTVVPEFGIGLDLLGDPAQQIPGAEAVCSSADVDTAG